MSETNLLLTRNKKMKNKIIVSSISSHEYDRYVRIACVSLACRFVNARFALRYDEAKQNKTVCIHSHEI